MCSWNSHIAYPNAYQYDGFCKLLLSACMHKTTFKWISSPKTIQHRVGKSSFQLQQKKKTAPSFSIHLKIIQFPLSIYLRFAENFITRKKNASSLNARFIKSERIFFYVSRGETCQVWHRMSLEAEKCTQLFTQWKFKRKRSKSDVNAVLKHFIIAIHPINGIITSAMNVQCNFLAQTFKSRSLHDNL